MLEQLRSGMVSTSPGARLCALLVLVLVAQPAWSQPESGVASASPAVDSACMLAPDVGMCRASLQRYFYNSTSTQCQTFIYGGCMGNANNFPTLAACTAACAPAAAAAPTTGTDPAATAAAPPPPPTTTDSGNTTSATLPASTTANASTPALVAGAPGEGPVVAVPAGYGSSPPAATPSASADETPAQQQAADGSPAPGEEDYQASPSTASPVAPASPPPPPLPSPAAPPAAPPPSPSPAPSLPPPPPPPPSSAALPARGSPLALAPLVVCAVMGAALLWR